MSKLTYEECRKLLHEIHTDTYDKAHIDRLLKFNNCDLENFCTGIAEQAFKFSYINSLQHANKLKRQILKNELSDFELGVVFQLNNVKSIDHALFELEKKIRKRKLVNEYRALYTEYRKAGRADITSASGCVNFLDILEFHNGLSNVQKDLRKELKEKLEQIDNEEFGT